MACPSTDSLRTSKAAPRPTPHTPYIIRLLLLPDCTWYDREPFLLLTGTHASSHGCLVDTLDLIPKRVNCSVYHYSLTFTFWASVLVSQPDTRSWQLYTILFAPKFCYSIKYGELFSVSLQLNNHLFVRKQ